MRIGCKIVRKNWGCEIDGEKRNESREEKKRNEQRGKKNQVANYLHSVPRIKYFC